jgi:CheY-like chemotaxis protein
MEGLKSTQHPAGMAREAAARGRTTKLRVHLVDDNQDAADSLARWMSLSGYETYVSYTGEEALEAAPIFQPDVMLVDIMLPGMDGYQLAGCLRDRDDFRQVVFIAVTGLSEQEHRCRSQDGKFSLHFSKPVDLDILNAVLASLAKKKRLAT